MKIVGLLFVIYISLTIAMQTGYYEAKLSEKTAITDEEMKQFETDVKNGKDVDIKDYIKNPAVDYSNPTTKAGVAFSNTVQVFMTKGIDGIVSVLKSLFT